MSIIKKLRTKKKSGIIIRITLKYSPEGQDREEGYGDGGGGGWVEGEGGQRRPQHRLH